MLRRISIKLQNNERLNRQNNVTNEFSPYRPMAVLLPFFQNPGQVNGRRDWWACENQRRSRNAG